MPSLSFSQLGQDVLVHVSTPAFIWTALIALLLFSVPAARNVAIETTCQIYVALVHRPFQFSPTDYLFSGQETPLPPTNSLLSRFQASTTLKWHAHRNGLRHEKDINWDVSDAVKDGDMIESWGRIAEWDQQCIHPHKLEQLRQIGDPIADSALDELLSVPNAAGQATTDTLRRIYDQVTGQREAKDESIACEEFWSAVDRRPPPGAGALGVDWYRSRYGSQQISRLEKWPRYSSTLQEEPASSLPIWSALDAAPFDAQDERDELEAEAEVLRRGQDVFYRYAGPILTVLLHFSLAGGFASPRITEVLKQTAYLVPTASANGKVARATGTASLPTIDDLKRVFNLDKPRADRTWNRLLETTQFVLDVVECAGSLCPPSSTTTPLTGSPSAANAGLPPPEKGGEGWQSAVRVRLLHTNVRSRVLKLAEKQRNGTTSGTAYNLEKNGVPINQEDMLGTLCAFSSAPLAMLHRIGISPTAQERNDYIALWRHVGFYMGIEPALLRRAFGDAQAADRTLWCTILHLFNKVEILDSQQGDRKGATAGPRMQGPTIPVLIACADRPPFHTPLSAHVAISRRLLGKSLADSLALPASSARREVLTDIAFLGMQVPILFGTFYPRTSWEKRKLELARPLLRRLIVFSFGNKRTKFEMPSPSSATSNTEAINGGKVNVETQSNAHVDVPEDKESNIKLVRQWQRLMREMMVVLFLTATLGAGAVAATYLYLLRVFV
ncbi:uncharacterized protein MEPE_03544 [Melanopsichium pennsylvanicum]|uniref:ER-bound oxygenase mpaB/mpaB'/Rubber oxygenase catalytic domain-containing protein n=2 Tax=Melanopsichium pennsylvanicum TaxID=63383 RepID=A0AAJ4XMA4_9BASI|nr:conserved hypothetical protein [Melanopsichium pennsylvanicum 4]SNX84835.1 uncharacterized protein MEPE_03544 [Melanopsichium pennsylvanicum]